MPAAQAVYFRVAGASASVRKMDASTEALNVARRTLAEEPNCHFSNASVAALPFADGSMDFGYSLGVLHHVPNTELGIAQCVLLFLPATARQ